MNEGDLPSNLAVRTQSESLLRNQTEENFQNYQMDHISRVPLHIEHAPIKNVFMIQFCYMIKFCVFKIFQKNPLFHPPLSTTTHGFY